MPHHREPPLEVLHCAPQQARTNIPPLLFLHGAYTAAWCWEHYLPWFAAAGFDCHALSLSGHGGSRRRDHLDSYSIDSYVADVVATVADLPTSPILIGHSMGGFVVQKYLERYAAPAAVLMCSVPPQGLVASALGMLFKHPGLLTDLHRQMTGRQVSLDSLRAALFAQPVAVTDLTRWYRMAQPESQRAIWDMTLFNLPRPRQVLQNLPEGSASLLVQGAELDTIIPASLVEMTARSYDTNALLYHGMGHGLMLEADWRRPAQDIVAWLDKRFS